MIKRILRKIKKMISTICSFLKYLLKNDIPVLYSYIFKSKIFIKVLKSQGIESPKPFMWNTWHLGYEYYMGIFQGSKVFIKYNKNSNWIRFETNNINLVKRNSEYLSKKIPNIYLKGEYNGGRYIVEDFLPFQSIEDIHSFSERNCEKIIIQLYNILKEFQKIDFMHLDLNTKNIYLDNKDNVYLIDFGFSNLRFDNINFIGNSHTKKQILSNLNRNTRLDIGIIDDAYSMLQVAKIIDQNLISSHYDLWLLFNEAAGKKFFDGKDLLAAL